MVHVDASQCLLDICIKPHCFVGNLNQAGLYTVTHSNIMEHRTQATGQRLEHIATQALAVGPMPQVWQ